MPMKEHVWTPSGAKMQEEMAETSRPNLEGRFVQVVCGKVTALLDIPWEQRVIVRALLAAGLNDDLRRWLSQYLNGQLETLAVTVATGLGVEPEVDHEYAVHAKFNSMLESFNSARAIIPQEGRREKMGGAEEGERV